MTTLAPTALDAAVATTRAQLAGAAPDLRARFADALPRAEQVVARRLVDAAYREDLAGLREPGRLARVAGGVRRHAFDRTTARVVHDPGRVLAELPDAIGGHGLAVELADAVVNLALAYARPPVAASAGAVDAVALAAHLAPDDQAVFFERLSTEGHNLHPCGRTRLGWRVADTLAHDLEAVTTTVGFVAVRRDLHIGDDLGELLDVGAAPPGYVVQPVHAWQRAQILDGRYGDLTADGALLPLDAPVLAGTPTAAVRTVLLDPRPGQPRRYLKLSLDIQVTSTRRTISVASTRNGPALAALLSRLLAGEPRLLLFDEEAGAAARVGPADRGLGAIVRRGIEDRLHPGEMAVPGGALYATSPVTGRTVLAELVDRYAATRRSPDPAAAAAAFLAEYALLLLPPLLRLAARHGIAIEAHLQNCVPTFRDGVPHRLALRDLAGLRVHRPRLAAAGHHLTLWPDSVIACDDADVMRAKLAYTALQAHLGELVIRLIDSHGLAEDAAWRAVRGIVDETYDGLRRDPATAAAAAADHAFLTAPLVPHKALVRMRLRGSGDLYVPVRNPLR